MMWDTCGIIQHPHSLCSKLGLSLSSSNNHFLYRQGGLNNASLSCQTFLGFELLNIVSNLHYKGC